MKKLILAMFLLVGTSQFSNAQIAFGIKGGINYNSNSIEQVSSNVLSGAEGKTGYHAGIWTRFKIPVIGFYLRPELVYTHLDHTITYTPTGGTAKATSLNLNKIDIPVLLGKKIFGVGNVFIGPSFQYVLKSGFSLSDIKEVKSSGFTMGLQFGGGLEFGKLGIDVRWERGFSSVESSFVDNVVGSNFNFDTRVNQIIIGLSYRL